MKYVSNKKTIIQTAALSLFVTSVSQGATIAAQTFDSDLDMSGRNETEFSLPDGDSNSDGLVDTYNLTDSASAVISYTGSGLGFDGYGRASSSGVFGTSGGKLFSTHGTSGSKRVLTTGKYGVTTRNQTDTNGIVFNSVNLTGFISKSFTMNVFEHTPETDEDLVVRLYLNGSSTAIDILSTVGNADTLLANATTGGGATFSAGTLTYNFADTDTSAELYIAVASDDGTGAAAEGYSFDNVSFEGTAVPEPSSTALLGLASLGFILRRRR